MLFSIGCSKNDAFDIPAQNFKAGFQTGVSETGRLTGTILFPSAYSQRTLSFTVDDRKFITQPDGRFLLEGLPVGQHRIVVVVKGYEPLVQSFTVGEDKITQLSSMKLSIARGRLLGRLVNEKGISAKDVAVRLEPQGGFVRTDSDGIFEFIGIHSGDYKLQVADTKFFTYDRAISLNSGEERDLGNIQVHNRVQMPVQSTARMAEK